jgi:Caspase domain
MNRIVLYAVALVLGLSCAAVAPQTALAEKRVALVIGNSAYKHAPALANPVKDAKAVAEMFQKSGFEVVSAEYDLDIVAFKRAVRKFEDAAGSSDIAVVYYAGHAIDVEGANYLIPVDAEMADDRDAEDEGVTLERLVESVDGAKKLRIIILDACRERPFALGSKHERAQALVGNKVGLSGAEPTTIDTLLAYAAKGGSIAVDTGAEHSAFTTALLDNLFVPGLDIRLAFGRVRDEVLHNTSNKQEPFVYGSLGATNIPLVVTSVTAAGTKTTEAGGEERDYHLVERIGSARAWEVFIAQHPTGTFSDMARQQIAKLTVSDAVTEPQAQAAAQSAAAQSAAAQPATAAAEPPKAVAAAKTEEPKTADAAKAAPPAEEAKPAAAPAAPAKEQVAALEHPAPAPASSAPESSAADTNSRDLIRKAQQELARLGCYSGAADGALGPGTAGALLDYKNARGAKSAGDVKITDDLLTELGKQSSRVCALSCGAGKVAQGDQCVAVQKPQPAAPKEAQAAAAATAPTPRPALIKQQPASGGSHAGSIGVGF